eukprot:CAMPEP_0204493528 /NCGR_PEP_ID=MMETSP0471-20130131/82280_1 /ASSEMBLY_ACC=CAM_ASM_000602 /TAXON_ID=2969 /ORGANISM="Oxyrrhis marina" /LENGTH=111 /DNA_ID=CAMNT_0051497663 /DNA_START=184 /DNA_END=515 /DNA_ORIENTATION=+
MKHSASPGCSADSAALGVVPVKCVPCLQKIGAWLGCACLQSQLVLVAPVGILKLPPYAGRLNRVPFKGGQRGSPSSVPARTVDLAPPIHQFVYVLEHLQARLRKRGNLLVA